jgi:hypothetical protein
MSITNFESWKSIGSLNQIQEFAARVQECMEICNPEERQSGLLRLVRELQVPIKAVESLEDLAAMFWNAMPKFVEFALIENALKILKVDFSDVHPESFECLTFDCDQQLDMSGVRVLRLNESLPNGAMKKVIESVEDDHGNGFHRLSAILGPGRYDLVRTGSKNAEQPITIVLDSVTDLETLELRTEWTLKPLEHTFLLLKRLDFSKMDYKTRRRSSLRTPSLYTSGNSNHINAFEVLSLRVPVVSWTTAIVNAALFRACDKKSEKIFFLDIGMSFGRNCIEFLKTLALHHIDVEVSVYGVDPDSASLDIASSQINKFAESHPSIRVKLTTIPHFLENIRPVELENMFESARQSDVRLVQSAFTMHHLSRENRQLALKNVVESCKPHAFVLSEPNVNHLEDDYQRRVSSALGMFSLLHELIHKDPKLSVDERFAVWNTFFGKEIVDIVGTNEEARSEKHEPIADWIQRGLGAGLQLSDQALTQELFPDETFDHPVCGVHFSKGLTEIQVHGTSIVGVMVFVADQ